MRAYLAMTIGLFILLGPFAAGNAGTSSTTQKRAPQALSLQQVVEGAIGPFRHYCDGYGNPGASGLGYITVLTLQTAAGPSDLDETLNEIIAFDRAEASSAYIGQINLIQASSFSGTQGILWGYHIAKADAIAEGKLKPLFTKSRPDGTKIPVYSSDPLLEAGRRLFGVKNKPRFPLLPGAHVVSAYKTYTAPGPATVWCAVGVGLAQDRVQEATLFMEDCGAFRPQATKESKQAFFASVLEEMAESVIRVAENQKVSYKEIFVGYKAQSIPEGSVGNALVAIPYIVLAQEAIPSGGTPKLLEQSLSDWEQDLGLSPLPKGVQCQ